MPVRSSCASRRDVMQDPNPQFPLFIPSKGRAGAGPITARVLDRMGVPFRIIVEEQEVEAYEAAGHAGRLLVLPARYKAEYDLLDDLGLEKSTGPGPARNFAWDVAVAEGQAWHWVMDDNIRSFLYRNNNRDHYCGDGALLRYAEAFTAQYANVLMAGPTYRMFMPRKAVNMAPITVNTRIYSCNLIRCDQPYRWRGRYNEDTILSLDQLTGGGMTIEWNFLLQSKMQTQTARGGNSREFYDHEGTLPKSLMLQQQYPEYVRLVKKFRRIHHEVDYRRAARCWQLRRDPAMAPPQFPALAEREHRPLGR